ncbi:hypothetical protein SOV_42870 [Sporomusa ovata DSM 2662]|nr:type I-B CRISPR-associated protein Cas7/Cst2/DevR [Sporomusa ovata]EQB26675.1 CRISPR-associated protein Cas7/Cst2/DevR, subtype I-B/TNEAP [Sporomusa ovata DSM 2662]
MSQEIKGITVTILFESASLNRGEKTSGNIMSIKKMPRENGVFPYMSREFMRHHLFNTIKYCYGWQDSPVTTTTAKNVIQFAFPEANIVMYPEMDLFGFMTTDNPVVTRKASIGLTKAIALEGWQSSMAFGANHDMVRRIKEAGQKGEPNPHQKEEHYGYYKISFTVDLCRFGYSENVLTDLDSGNRIIKWFEQQEDVESHAEVVTKCRLVNCEKIEKFDWKVLKTQANVFGFVGMEKKKELKKIVFAVTDIQRKERLAQLLTVLKNGLMLHSDTENYGVVPQFIACACLTMPVPVLNDFVRLQNGQVDRVAMETGLSNAYIQQAWCDGILATGEGYQGAAKGFAVPQAVDTIFLQGNN